LRAVIDDGMISFKSKSKSFISYGSTKCWIKTRKKCSCS